MKLIKILHSLNPQIEHFCPPTEEAFINPENISNIGKYGDNYTVIYMNNGQKYGVRNEFWEDLVNKNELL